MSSAPALRGERSADVLRPGPQEPSVHFACWVRWWSLGRVICSQRAGWARPESHHHYHCYKPPSEVQGSGAAPRIMLALYLYISAHFVYQSKITILNTIASTSTTVTITSTITSITSTITSTSVTTTIPVTTVTILLLLLL